MKKYRKLTVATWSLMFAFTCSLEVFANSSWRWISETRPYDLLPVVIILTLAIETVSIHFISKLKNIAKTIFIVLAANTVSFLTPYCFLYCVPSLYTFEQMLEHQPIYNVGLLYLIITLAVEIPIVYFSLKKSAPNPKKMMLTVLLCNVATTILTAVIENTVCKGIW